MVSRRVLSPDLAGEGETGAQTNQSLPKRNVSEAGSKPSCLLTLRWMESVSTSQCRSADCLAGSGPTRLLVFRPPMAGFISAQAPE